VTRDSFAKIVELSRLKEAQSYMLAAPEGALAEIAARLDVPAVEALTGTLRVTPTAEGAAVDGSVEARLARQCVVTLEPMEERIAEKFAIRFARESDAASEVELDLDDEWTEPLSGDTLDLADILVQQVALAMDPYPRKPGAEAPAELRPSPEQVSPFAALKALKPDADQKN
jgi:uncharacterized metal-binding protein YceD (DUF177 family)